MIQKIRTAFIAALFGASLFGALPVAAQGPTQCAVSTAAPTYNDGQNRSVSCDTAGSLRVNASVSASITGFAPATTGTPISVTNLGVTGTLPAGTVVAAFNTGTANTAFCKLGAAATTSDIAIAPGGWFGFTVGVATQLTCITATSTTTVNMVGGSGLPSGVGGFGGLTDTQLRATPVPVSGTVTANAGTNLNTSLLALEAGGNLAQVVTDFGAPGAVACATDTASCNLNQYVQRLAQRLSTINTTLGTPFQAGGALAANQSVNVAQINGVTTLMGNGATGTGSQRVTIANDSSAIAVKGEGATGAAVPSGARLTGVQSGANMVAAIQGSTTVALTMSTATTTEFVALSGSTKIYITAIDFVAAGTTNVTLKYGTGSNCGTGTTSISGVYTLTAQAGIAKGGGLGPVIVIPASQAFCVTNSAAVVIGGTITYTQF